MNMKIKNLNRILFLDIETVSLQANYAHLDYRSQCNWNSKAKFYYKHQNDLNDVELQYKNKAGIYAEFSKVICISLGWLSINASGVGEIKIKSFSGKDESQILRDFKLLLDKFFYDPNIHFLAGHNIREFDIPFISRRMIVNNLSLPSLLNLSGKKPWQISHLIDTMEMWKFGDYKNYTSLDLLAQILNIATPKDELDGSKIHDTYYLENDLAKIQSYCEKDVITSIKVYLRMSRLKVDLDNLELQFY